MRSRSSRSASRCSTSRARAMQRHRGVLERSWRGGAPRSWEVAVGFGVQAGGQRAARPPPTAEPSGTTIAGPRRASPRGAEGGPAGPSVSWSGSPRPCAPRALGPSAPARGRPARRARPRSGHRPQRELVGRRPRRSRRRRRRRPRVTSARPGGRRRRGRRRQQSGDLRGGRQPVLASRRLLVEACVLDRHAGGGREGDHDASSCSVKSPRRLLGQVEVAEDLAAGADRDPEERAHRRVVGREPVGRRVRGDVVQPQRYGSVDDQPEQPVAGGRSPISAASWPAIPWWTNVRSRRSGRAEHPERGVTGST